MDSDRDSRSSPMTSARDALWRNIRAISNLVSGNNKNSQTQSSSQNQNMKEHPINSSISILQHNDNNLSNSNSQSVVYNNARSGSSQGLDPERNRAAGSRQTAGGNFNTINAVGGSNQSQRVQSRGAPNNRGVHVGFEGRATGYDGANIPSTALQSSTASVSNNRDDPLHDDLMGQPIIVHDDNYAGGMVAGGRQRQAATINAYSQIQSNPFYASNHGLLRQGDGRFEDVNLNGGRGRSRGRSGHNRVAQGNDDIYADDVISPLVVLDRHREAILSEEEVRQILDMYNKNLDQATQENKELKDQIELLISHLREEEQRVYAVQQEIHELKNQQVSNQAELEKQNLQVSLLKFFKEAKEKNPLNEEQEVEQFKQQMFAELGVNDDLGVEALSDLEDQIKCMKRLEHQVKLLELESDFLSKAHADLDQQLNQEKKCVNCKKHFRVNENSESACNFHFGKMKYFSCKGCGSEEYYACCWRCMKCNPGCRQSKHIAEAD